MGLVGQGGVDRVLVIEVRIREDAFPFCIGACVLEGIADGNEPAAQLAGNCFVGFAQSTVHVLLRESFFKERVILAVGPRLMDDNFGRGRLRFDEVVHLLREWPVSFELEAVHAGLLERDEVPLLRLQCGPGAGLCIRRALLESCGISPMDLDWRPGESNLFEGQRVAARLNYRREEGCGVVRKAVAGGQQLHVFWRRRFRACVGQQANGCQEEYDAKSDAILKCHGATVTTRPGQSSATGFAQIACMTASGFA